MTSIDINHSEENRNIVDLCCYCFGMGLSFLLMYFLGMNIYLYGPNWSMDGGFIFANVVGFILLTGVTGFGFFAIVFKIKQLV